MQTITTKELRDNMDKMVRRVQAGEPIKVTYRSKPAFTMQPEPTHSDKPTPGSPKAIKQFIDSTKKLRTTIPKGVFDPQKSVKELYREMLDNDPKYKPPYHR